MYKKTSLILVLLMAFFKINTTLAFDPLDLDLFQFPEPSMTDLGQPLKLWATYYYLPQMSEDLGANSLRNMKGEELGPRLTLKQWCYTAMEGSVKIDFKNGDSKTFNYQGTTSDYYVDCKSIFPKHLGIGRTKFREANGQYGDGLDDYILSPYRTLATDANIIKPGTALYIPQARGARIVVPGTGRVIIHDGYFFAADKGGAIKGTHVDVYIGNSLKADFFSWIGSSETKSFSAYLVKDQKTIQELLELHTQK